MEGDSRLRLVQDLLRQIDGQRLLTITQRQQQLPMMGLTTLIRHISHHHEVIEHRIGGLRNLQRHLHLEGTVALGLCLTRVDLLVATVITQRRGFVITTERHPPEGRAPHDTVRHLSALYRHTGIAQGRSLHGDGVTSPIGFLIVVEVDMEGRPLVFLHPDHLTIVPHLYVETPRQRRRRQEEVDSRQTVVVCHDLLLLQFLIIGIAQDDRQRLSRTDTLFAVLGRAIDQGRHMDRLTRTIDGPIREDGNLVDIRRTVIEIITIVS